jgi:DNA-binding CsgD family transcriptional regulator
VDARSRQRIVAEIRAQVPFQWYVWVITDPRTSVGASPVADIPPGLVARLPEVIRLKYLTPVNRWTTVDGSPAFLHRATGGDPRRSLVWRDLLHEYSIVDIATLVFRDRFGCWGFLDLWRQSVPFDDRDAALLARRVEPVTALIRQGIAETFTGHTLPGASGPVVLILSPSLEVRGSTPATGEYLRALVPPGDGRAPVPAGAYNVAAQLLAVEAGVDANPPTARVHLAGGRWLHLRAARLGGAVVDEGDSIAVTIEDASPADRIDLFARSCGLSPRETELLGLLASGHDTRHVAGTMVLSEHTVHDHLKSIFAKSATRTRRSLLARALGS